jgi:hypothetical protein
MDLLLHWHLGVLKAPLLLQWHLVLLSLAAGLRSLLRLMELSHMLLLLLAGLIWGCRQMQKDGCCPKN